MKLTMMKLRARKALLPGGWADEVVISIDESGKITDVTSGPQTKGIEVDEDTRHLLVPGLANLHSHAHQRFITGLTEVAGPGEDSFWTWRDTMYRYQSHIAPEDLQAVAAQLYLEMLKGGYTSVGEFHYLHHAPDGQPYANIAEMGAQLLEAAKHSGIGMTLLPVLYASAGFGGRPTEDSQKRFANDTNRFLDLWEASRHQAKDYAGSNVGIAPHSLRAAPPEVLDEVVRFVRNEDPASPIHIHIAEQTKEVEDCLQWSGARPVEWLLDNEPVDDHWCLIHATHINGKEVKRMAASGAVAGLCPTTEANLGDGLFPAVDFLAQKGVFGLGSDSHITIDPADEIRILEYGQRLSHQGRNLLAGAPKRSTGRNLFEAALAGGAQALGRKTGQIKVGLDADLVALNSHHASLYARQEDTLIDSWVFAAQRTAVSDVWARGQKVIENGRHRDEIRIRQAFNNSMRRLK